MSGTHHRGLAGQLAVMAHLAWNNRGVAIPMVDEGTDVLALRRGHRRPYRIQVKTSEGKRTRGAQDSKYKDKRLFKCQFNIPRSQLADDDGPFYYVLVAYVRERFRFVVVERTAMENSPRITGRPMARTSRCCTSILARIGGTSPRASI
jgi:hypothetical protein